MNEFTKEYSRLGTYSTQWDFIHDRFGEKNLLPFSISDMDFRIPEGTRTKLLDINEKGFFGYTRWNHQDYQQAVTNWFNRRFLTSVQQDWVTYSPSVIYSLSVCIQLLSQEKDKIATFTPCYDAFFSCIEENNRELLSIPLIQDLQPRINFALLEEKFSTDRPAAFLLCNPHNPTGRAFSEKELKQLIFLCNQHHVSLISDEIHMDICRPHVRHYPIVNYLSEMKIPCVLLSSGSKTFNCPGLGGSYALFPDPHLREKFLKRLKGRDGLSSIPYPALVATMDCYNNQEKWVDQLNQTIDTNFEYVKNQLDKHTQIRYSIPDASYLAWIDLGDMPFSMDQLQKEMITHQKIAMMRGETYGPEGKGFLRFNLGAPPAKIMEGTERLLAAMDTLLVNHKQ